MSNQYEKCSKEMVNLCGITEETANNAMDCSSKLSLDWSNLSIVDAMQSISDGTGYSGALIKYGIFIQTNNYRKMHGLPMRRRGAK